MTTNTAPQSHRSKTAVILMLMGVALMFGAATIAQRGSTNSASAVEHLNAGESADADAAAVAVVTVKEVTLKPGQDVRSIVKSNPAGTTFYFEPGIYALPQQVEVRSGDSYIGLGDVVFYGGRKLTNWQRDEDGRWYVTGQNQAGERRFHPDWKPCESGYERCINPEDLFINRQPLRHVDSYNKLAAGKWFFDYDADRIYLFDDPNGQTVETSVTSRAFVGKADNVTLKNFTVELFASPVQIGAIQANEISNGWLIDNVTAQYNHGAGINLIGHRHIVRNSRMNLNALKGLGGGGTPSVQGDGILIENNEFGYNNWGRAHQSFDCCGLKLVRTDNVVIRGNVAHHNHGKGIWTDIDNRNALIEKNIAYQNFSNGIYHEISWKATIRDNWASQNGQMDSDRSGVYHAQIMVVNSSDVEVTGNIVVVGERGNGIGLQQNPRGEENQLKYGKPRTNNVWVHHNTIVLTTAGSGGNVGLATNFEQDAAYRPGNNRFDHNTYYVTNSGDMGHKRFVWRSGTANDVHMDWNNFRKSGQEANGQLISGVPSALLIAPNMQALRAVAPTCDEIVVQAGAGRREIARLRDGDIYSLDVVRDGRALNVVAVCSADTESVKFEVDGAFFRMENSVPYELVGDQPPHEFANGTYVITMSPANRDHAQGFVGKPLYFTLQVPGVVVQVPAPTLTMTPAPTLTFTPTEVVITLAPSATPIPPTLTMTEVSPVEPTFESIIVPTQNPEVERPPQTRRKFVFKFEFWIEDVAVPTTE